MKLLPNLILLFLITSCSNYKVKEAKMFMADGFYEDARDRWMEVLSDDPKNSEAKVGIKKSEQEILNKMFISVRDLRNAGNYEGSLNKATESFTLVRDWGANTDYSSFTFIGGEIKKLFPFYEKRIVNSLKSKPIKAKVLYQEHSKLFTAFMKEKMITLNKKIVTKLSRYCTEIINKAANISVLLFNSVCSSEGRQVASTQLDVKISNKIKTNSKIQQSILTDELKDFIVNNKFFQLVGGEVDISITGSITEKINEWKSDKYHRYTETTAYTTHEKMLRTRNVPYQATRQVCNTNGCYSQYYTKYNVEYYYVTEPVTKYRSNDKNYKYSVTNLNINHIHNLKIRVRFGNELYQSKYVSSKKISDYYHSISLPNIGLTEKSIDSIDMDMWVALAREDIKGTLLSKVQREWKNKWCNLSQHKNTIATINSISNCAAVDPSHKTVNNWFRKNVGLSYTAFSNNQY